MACGVLPLVLAGCRAAEPEPQTTTVAQALSDAQPQAFAPSSSASSADAVTPLARVNGVPIERAGLIDVLIEGHGVGLLEQWIVLEAARRRAHQRGIAVSPDDVDREYRRSLDVFLGDAGEGQSSDLRTRAAETLLEQMLASRNMSRSEYMIVTERNAILRTLVAPEITLEKDAIQLEFERLYGERVEIRHIQTSSAADFERMLQERASGAEFGDLALRYSANRASAERLGLLPPFPRDDPSIPEAIRREAFLLPTGQDSNLIHIDGWYHIVRVERRIEASPLTLDEVRGEVERSLRDRLTEAAMRDKYAEIFDAAKVEVLDPRFKELFFEKHPDHGTARR